MPRDRRPEFKSQIRIKGRAFGIPKGISKELFMFFREIDRTFIAEGKTAPHRDELIKRIFSHPDYYADYKRIKEKEVGNHSSRL